jgi:hypothetical protein
LAVEQSVRLITPAWADVSIFVEQIVHSWSIATHRVVVTRKASSEVVLVDALVSLQSLDNGDCHHRVVGKDPRRCGKRPSSNQVSREIRTNEKTLPERISA